MAISAISGASSIQAFRPPTLSGVSGTGAAGSVGGAAGAAGTQGPNFAAGLQSVEKALAAADVSAAKVATGTATDLHQVTIDATKAQLAVGLTVALRDRAVEAYQEIMRMAV